MSDQVGLNVGLNVDKDSLNNLSQSLINILKAAGDSRTNDSVTLAALSVLEKSCNLSNFSISNCHISTDSSKKVVVQVPEDYEPVDTKGVSIGKY